MKKHKYNPKYAEARCFIFSADGYEEITYSELYQRSATNPEYASRKFIPLHGMLMEVTNEQYANYYKTHRRNRYLKEQEQKRNLISLDNLKEKELTDVYTIISDNDPIDQATNSLLIEKLLSSLQLLTAEERELIYALFSSNLSEHELSKKTGIPQKTINDRKHKILAKLHKLIGG